MRGDQRRAALGQRTGNRDQQIAELLPGLPDPVAVLDGVRIRSEACIPLHVLMNAIAERVEALGLLVDGKAHGDGRFEGARLHAADNAIKGTHAAAGQPGQIDACLVQMRAAF